MTEPFSLLEEEKEELEDHTQAVEQWEPQRIAIQSTSGPVNLMDYLRDGPQSHNYLYFPADSATPIDPTNPADRRCIVRTLRAACADAGFELMCKGWEGGPRRLKFCCSRGAVYKSTTDSTKKRRSVKPMNASERCPFSFTLHWTAETKSWCLRGGYGCRFHRGHERQDDLRSKRRVTDFATAMGPVFAEMARLADASPRAVDLQMRQDLLSLLHTHRHPASRYKKPKHEVPRSKPPEYEVL